eukprot:IDg2800t1
MATKFTKDEVKRTYLPLLGVDMLQICSARACTHALATGDLVRVDEVIPTPNELPWLFRNWFPVSRFMSEPHGLFMPMRGDMVNYADSRAYLEAAFAPGKFDMSEHVRATARLLADPNRLPNDRTLGAAFARAMSQRFTPRTAELDVAIEAAHNQAESLPDSFVPWRRYAAAKGLSKVYSFFEEELAAQEHKGARTLPPSATVDVAHSILASLINGPAVLREIAANPNEDASALFVRLGKVEEVLRMVTRETTLAGLVSPDRPVYPGTTMVRINIGQVTRETGDVAWAFGSGTERRRCAAEGEIIRFVRAVQLELKQIRSKQEST